LNIEDQRQHVSGVLIRAALQRFNRSPASVNQARVSENRSARLGSP
jgi:hypothetical protein